MSEQTLSEPIRAALSSGLEAVMLGLDVEGTIEMGPGEGDETVVRVVTEHAEPLIGRGGATINALQFIAGQIAFRADDGPRQRIVVDVNDYRERRTRALEALAERAAEEAQEYGEEIELDAMNPAERRIIHMALKGREGIETRSEGDEPRRRIIVVPAEASDD